MTTWYGLLYVTVEGWRKLRCTDPGIEAILGTVTTVQDEKGNQLTFEKLLKRFRNTVFYYYPNYFSKKYVEFISYKEAVSLVTKLSAALGAWFLTELKKYPPKSIDIWGQ